MGFLCWRRSFWWRSNRCDGFVWTVAIVTRILNKSKFWRKNNFFIKMCMNTFVWQYHSGLIQNVLVSNCPEIVLQTQISVRIGTLLTRTIRLHYLQDYSISIFFHLWIVKSIVNNQHIIYGLLLALHGNYNNHIHHIVNLLCFFDFAFIDHAC